MKNNFIKQIAEIDEFKGFWKGLTSLPIEMLYKLRVLATIESIGSSTRIEGAKLTDREVEALLSGLMPSSFRSRDEEEVAGYADAMKLIYESHDDIELIENNIKYLHKVLLKHSSNDQWHIGNYKQQPNHVAAFDETGRQVGIVFETTSPADTPREMETLVSSTILQLNKGELHPLFIIADFILRFLAIHPFQDGNGRLSRILTNLLLLRFGYDYVQYSSLERVVEANKERYYSSLRTAQNALKEGKSDTSVWTGFFLEMLKKQQNLLAQKLERERKMSVRSKLSNEVLNYAEEQGRVTVGQLARALDANRNTIKTHLQKLVQEGLLKLHGKGRGSYYTPN
ncbi:MAG: Fic family protein [Candidatus Hatepunaea meridiana]|nr:Fic family protein [Candidatus Hatepunaea meridiana]